MSAEAPDVRPDLHQLITLFDNGLSKTEAGAVLPERICIHLKEERAPLVNLLESWQGNWDRATTTLNLYEYSPAWPYGDGQTEQRGH